MLSKNKIKELSLLHLKKHRDHQNVFIAEGSKLVTDLIPTFTCKTLVASNNWISKNKPKANEIIIAEDGDIKKISLLKTPQDVYAIFEKPATSFNKKTISSCLSLALDGIQDPGNLGTILRIADWFGIEHVFCSLDCADIFNPKTIQASMGAIARVKAIPVELAHFLSDLKNETPIYGTFLNGKNLYTETLSNNGIIVMGNEGNGISKEIELIINKALFIPSFPENRNTSESLNVGSATAIVCNEFRRRNSQQL